MIPSLSQLVIAVKRPLEETPEDERTLDVGIFYPGHEIMKDASGEDIVDCPTREILYKHFYDTTSLGKLCRYTAALPTIRSALASGSDTCVVVVVLSRQHLVAVALLKDDIHARRDSWVEKIVDKQDEYIKMVGDVFRL